MLNTFTKVHSFNLDQRVQFLGGEGIVRNLKFEAENWTYLVEMPLGIEPNFGRIGAETMILLGETELRAARA
jgi:hypothetical protein